MTIWGDGRETRSFLHIGKSLEGVQRLVHSSVAELLNIGPAECVSIHNLAERIIGSSGKQLSIRTTPGPQGVRGRTSDNTLIAQRLGWAPSRPLDEGLRTLYAWVGERVEEAR